MRIRSFTIPRNRWSTARGIKSAPRTLTPEQREASIARLAAARKRQGETN